MALKDYVQRAVDFFAAAKHEMANNLKHAKADLVAMRDTGIEALHAIGDCIAKIKQDPWYFRHAFFNAFVETIRFVGKEIQLSAYIMGHIIAVYVVVEAIAGLV